MDKLDLDQEVTLSYVAKLFSVNAQNLRKLSSSGKIPPVKRAKINLLGAIQGYVEHLKDVAAVKGRRDASAGDLDLKKEQARFTSVRADLAELELEIARRDVITVDELSQALSAMTTAIRVTLINELGRDQGAVIDAVLDSVADSLEGLPAGGDDDQ